MNREVGRGIELTKFLLAAPLHIPNAKMISGNSILLGLSPYVYMSGIQVLNIVLLEDW